MDISLKFYILLHAHLHFYLVYVFINFLFKRVETDYTSVSTLITKLIKYMDWGKLQMCTFRQSMHLLIGFFTVFGEYWSHKCTLVQWSYIFISMHAEFCHVDKTVITWRWKGYCVPMGLADTILIIGVHRTMAHTWGYYYGTDSIAQYQEVKG